MLITSAILATAILAAPGPGQFPGVSDPVPVRETQNELRFEARLDGDGLASGKAKYRERDRKGSTQLRFSVQIEDAAPNTTYEILLNGVAFASVTTDALGAGDFDVRNITDDPGQLGVVPKMNDGDEIEVAGLISGTLH